MLNFGRQSTYPVLGSLPYERTLAPSCARITLYGVTTRAHEVVELGELDDKGIPVIFIKGTTFEVILDERRLEGTRGLFL